MTEKIITLVIEKLAGLGDGVGHHEGRRIFVAYTLPGDVVRARIVHETKEAIHAALEEIVTPGPGRIAPVCRHFSDCGGCDLQHVRDDIYADFKWQMAREAVRKAGFDPASVTPILRMPPASRRRVDLGVRDGRLGYFVQGSHRLVDMEECKVVEPALEAMLLRLKPELVKLPGLEAVQINGVDEGYDVLLCGEGPSQQWRISEDKDARRVSVYENGLPRVLHQSGPVTVTLGGVKIEVPPRAFLQASREAQTTMTQQVLAMAGQGGRVLDLFAGVGTYSFPLAAQGGEVTAVEGNAAMVKAMRKAVQGQGTKMRIKAVQRDLFRRPFGDGELNGYDVVVINPPHPGAKEQSAALARAKVKKLVMISCNPATFARDARLLKEGGYALQKALPIDQFIYSSHLEILAEFAR
jgi:23S rRNA (uracil1939-C5)-methyltransferase